MKDQDLRAKVIARAWKDASFKRKLMTNPRAALKEMGYKIPDNMDVIMIEDTATAFTFVLPPAPAKLHQMSDAELRQLAAAGEAAYGLGTVLGTKRLGRGLDRGAPEGAAGDF